MVKTDISGVVDFLATYRVTRTIWNTRPPLYPSLPGTSRGTDVSFMGNIAVTSKIIFTDVSGSHFTYSYRFIVLLLFG